jgi:hypothetical protein
MYGRFRWRQPRDEVVLGELEWVQMFVGGEYRHVSYLLHRVINKSYSDKSRGNRLTHTTLKNALKVIQVQPSLAEQAFSL